MTKCEILKNPRDPRKIFCEFCEFCTREEKKFLTPNS